MLGINTKRAHCIYSVPVSVCLRSNVILPGKLPKKWRGNERGQGERQGERESENVKLVNIKNDLPHCIVKLVGYIHTYLNFDHFHCFGEKNCVFQIYKKTGLEEKRVCI